jgi:transposase InsO family protein
MIDFVKLALNVVALFCKSRGQIEAENAALRQQLAILRRRMPRRPQLTTIDRLIFVWLYHFCPSMMSAMAIVKPETIIRWHRAGLRAYWRWKSRNRSGRLPVRYEIRKLIRAMSMQNPLWGAPRIHGELRKLGIAVAQSTVAKYMHRRRNPPSPGWTTFLRNHAAGIVAVDLFVVPTITFRILYGVVVLRHDRRLLISVAVTDHPTAEWIARQITEAFPWNETPRYIIRDRDSVFGHLLQKRLRAMGIRDRPVAPGSPWQNGHVERLIGSIRRECLGHVIVLGERHLRRLLAAYAAYYNQVRTHLALGKDAPLCRPIQSGRVMPLPVLGGLHHHYVRMA